MSAPDSIKFLFLFALCFSSCGWRAAKTAENASVSVAEELKSTAPFSTQEPENFQAEFVVTINDSENKIFVARSGNRRRYDYNAGAANQLTTLERSAGEKFLILPNEKIYALNSAAQNSAMTENSKDFLTNELLNQKPDAKFSRLAAENGLTKYVVRFDDSAAAETIVFVDEAINLPVRQEFYSIKDGQKILTYTVEMKNFKTQVNENLFDAPKDFRKVSIETLRAAMRAAKTNGE